MASKKKPREGIVWDTAMGQTCPGCGAVTGACQCSEESALAGVEAGPVRVLLDRKGRGGKSVTVVEGVRLAADELRKLAKELKRRTGTGGSVKDGRIEIQGDQRDLVISELESRGHEVRRVGG